MAYENDILTRNDNDELAVRTVQSVGDNPVSSYDDVYTRDNNGKLAVRVVGSGGGDSHNKGYFATQAALEEAHPTAEAGDWAIVGSTDTVWVWDEDSSAWVDTDTKGEVTPDMIIVKSATMPTASTTPAGAVYQYVGASDANYTHGYIYENVATTTSSSATASQTTGSSLSDVAVVLATFETQITTSGSYAFTSDGTNWSYDGNTVDLTDYGITYTGTPVADDVITVVYTESSTTYAWTQTNVQPAPSGLPDQTGQSGKFLTTDGTDASWSDKPLVNKDTHFRGLVVGSNDDTSGTGNTVIGSNSTSYGGNCNTVLGAFSQGRNASTVIGYGIQDSTSQNAVIIRSGAQYSGTVTGVSDAFCWIKRTTVYELFSADGTIPADRLVHAINKYSTMPTAASTNEGWIVQFTGTTDAIYTHGHLYECVSDGGNPATYSWTEVSMGGGGSATATTATLAANAWSSNSQTVNVTGVTSSNNVIVAPAPASQANYTAAGIICSAQAAGTLTFTCATTPTTGITVNVLILG